MMAPHALGILADAIAGAVPADLAEARDRRPPDFPPFIRKPAAPRLAETCAECEGPHKGRAELLHTALMGAPGVGAVHVVSTYPLCPACAAAGRRHGWPALTRTWRKVCAAPFEAAALASALVRGDAH